MSVSNSEVIMASFIVAGMILLVRVSDSASVPISSSPSTIPIVSKDNIDLELLASSKILMDHTSSSFSTSTSKAAASLLKTISTFQTFHKDDEDVRLAKDLLQEKSQKNTDISSASSGTDSTLSEQQTKKISSKKVQPQQEEQQEQFLYSSGRKNEQNSYEMSSPLHVARCRATCLQKFNIIKNKEATSLEVMKNPTLAEGKIQFSPILRFRRASSPSLISEGAYSCVINTSDCQTCWKSCETLENGINGGGVTSDHFSSRGFTRGKANEAKKKTGNPLKAMTADDDGNEQSFLDCSSVESSKCSGGCQVACFFYEQLGKGTGESSKGKKVAAFKENPVVGTKHESVMKLLPGKITWPSYSSLSTKKEDNSGKAAVVYVVIQEYPGRKWRQITQTTDTNMDIPTELISTSSGKLRSVRVLVVGSEGLLSVYSTDYPREAVEEEREEDKGHMNSEKSTESNSRTVTEAVRKESESIGKLSIESNDSSSSANTNDHLETDPVDFPVTSKTIPATEALSHLTEEEIVSTPSTNNNFYVEGPFSFELRLVSLIHQKSLVIAELKWDEIGRNPSQEYLITWELTEGGLKGHLVTDSTSVTLSLWPDTMYSIQVEDFKENLDSDGEQPAHNTSPSMKSVPLIVDTSTASFPLGESSSLLTKFEDNQQDEYDNGNELHSSVDEFSLEHNPNENEEGEILAHKSFMDPSDTSFIISITLMSTTLVLLTLALVAFAWARLRMARSLKLTGNKVDVYFSGEDTECCGDTFIQTCYSKNILCNCLSTSDRELQLLSLQDDDIYISSPAITKKKPGKICKGCSFSSHKKYKLGGLADYGLDASVMPVAVISSTLSLSSLSSGRTSDSASLYDNYPYKNGYLLPSSLTSPQNSFSSSEMKGDWAAPVHGPEGLIKWSEQGSTSSSCWLPNATCTNSATHTNNLRS